MLGNYIKTSLRQFRRSKTHTLINLTGLTLGFLCAVIIFQKVRFELSYGTQHTEAERIFRVVHEANEFGNIGYQRGVPYPFVDAFRADFPAVEHVTIVDRNFQPPVIAIDRPNGEVARFLEDSPVGFADPDYFEIFTYEWLQGNPPTALAEPRTVVLSETLARKYFGDNIDPMGRTLRFGPDLELTVTGLVEDPAPNNMMPLQMIMSFNLGEEHERGNENWGSTSSSVQAYLRLPEGMTTRSIERQFPEFLARYRDADDATSVRYYLQALPDIHFDTRFGDNDGQPVTSKNVVLALGLIGLVLLLTACINFINLSTVLVFKRAREVGVRKVLGGTPGQIISYFMTETGLITVMALLVALVLATPVAKLARGFIGEGFSVNPLTDPWLALFVVAAAVVLTLGSGLYPAFLLSRLRPTVAIRGSAGQKPGAFLSMRRGLVVVQFAISQVLIICTLAAMWQIRHLHNVPLGYDTEAIVEFAVPQPDETTLETMKNRMLQSAAIQHVTFSNSGASSGTTWASNFHYERGDERIENHTQMKLVDPDYVETYGMTLLAGSDFDELPPDSVTHFVANEAFVKLIGFDTPEEALGTFVDSWSWQGTIEGVVRNFNTNSLHQEIEATLLVPTLVYAYQGAAKVNTAQLNDALATIERAWQDAFPDYVFEYRFLDETIANFYESEQIMQRLIQVFAFIAILIGCIGLFGLISYTTSQRSKEVGIRKVLGASVPSIVGLFAREFALMVVIGFAVSAPLAYFVMGKWLENYPYRIDLGAGLFVIAFAVSLTIALVTVGFKTYQAAVANPVDSIRSDS